MDFAHVDLPVPVVLAAWMLALPLFALGLARARWREVSGGAMAQVWPAALIVLAILWSIRTQAGPGLAVHLSGIAALALATGPWLALVGGAVVVAIASVLFGAPWTGAAPAWLVGVAWPVGVVTTVHAAAQARLPPNFFVYAFVVAFFGSAAAFVTTGLVGAGLLVAAMDVAPSIAFGEYAVVVAALAFGEALLTGMAITLAAIYRPTWVATFEPNRYFGDGPDAGRDGGAR